MVKKFKFEIRKLNETDINSCISLFQEDDQIIGFADISYEGYLDRLYIHTNYQRKGIASALLKKLENEAIKHKLTQITTEASITAKPFFLKKGFYIVKEQMVEIRDKKLRNYLMEKDI